MPVIKTAGAIIAVVFVGWNLSEHWYPIAIAVTAFPCTWLGGKMKAAQPARVTEQ
jgi:hypothetical protein